MDNKKLIVKHNKLIEANYKLTLQEQKIILILAATIKKDDTKFEHCTFRVEKLANLLELKKDAYYSELKEITEKLLSRVLTIKENDGDLQVSWLSSAKYYDDLGKVELSFSKKLKPYLLQLSTHFTKLEYKKLISLNSIYAIRIYELCKQYERLRKREITIAELKRILQVEDIKSYNRYNNFKRRVLLKAKNEINEKTDLEIDFEELKTGRKVTSIKFIIKKKEGCQEKIEFKGFSQTKKYSKEVLQLFFALPKEEQVEAHKKELEKLLRKYNFKYLKADIEYAKQFEVKNFFGFLKSSCERGHYSAAGIEKKEKKKKLAQKRKEEEERKKELKERIRKKAEKKAIEQYEKMSEAEITEYKSTYEKLPNMLKDKVSLREFVIGAIEEDIERELEELVF